MPTFAIISLIIASAAALTAAICALDLWVRKEAARGQFIVREKYTLCNKHIARTLWGQK